MDEIKGRIISMFKDIELFLNSEEYSVDLRHELNALNPDYLVHLEKRRKDMEKSDHGIVIAGETSAGKSTLINKLLGKRIFKGSIFESTSTICKLQNSDRIVITAKNDNGIIDERDLTEKCDLKTPKGVKVLRDSLKELTDKTSLQESTCIRSVDVKLPIPFLKGNTFLVDTPGIGGSPEVSQKLKDYLPNAISFVFVINVASAGGMQRDRLPEILNTIIKLKMENEMPCFDPEDVVFITNKWDTIAKKDSDDDSDDDEIDKTWEILRENIKQSWPLAKDENIFRMSLTEVSSKDENISKTEFGKFQSILENNIKKALNIKVIRHFSFLKEIMTNISKGINARRELVNKTEKEQNDLAETHRNKINIITEECKKIRAALQEKIEKTIEETAKECHDFMSTEEGKNSVLNPVGHPLIQQYKWKPKLFSNVVQERVVFYATNMMQSDAVKRKFESMKDEIRSFYKTVSVDLFTMETVWTGVLEFGNLNLHDDADISTPALVGAAIATSPVWLPLVAAGIGLALAFGSIGVVLSPIIVPVVLVLSRDERKKQLIDEAYQLCLNEIQTYVRHELKEGPGDAIRSYLDIVTEGLVPKRVRYLENMIQHLEHSRNEILARQKMLDILAMKMGKLERSAKDLQKKMN